MPPRCLGRLLVGLILALAVRPAPVAGQDLMARAFDLERRGSYEEAARVYRGILAGRPGDLGALLGLERALTPINRLPSMVPEVQSALAQGGVSPTVYSVALRTYAAAGLADSLPRLVDRWSRAAPGDETPFREWAAAALQNRDRSTARLAYRTGRERLGRRDALAAEMAQLAVQDQDWPTAAREWVRAAEQLPGYRSSASATLAQAPGPDREAVIGVLDGEPGAEAGRIAADLLVRWGDPLAGFARLSGSLPTPRPQQIEQLQTFLEQCRASDAPAYRRAQAMTLEALSERWTLPAQRARARLDAARAYADVGDLSAARRLLALAAADTASNRGIAADALVTLIDLLVREGSLGEATRMLAGAEGSTSVDDFLRLRRSVALGWASRGEIERGVALLAGDSTVEGSAALGWIRLYGGDLAGAVTHWRDAGPFAGTRAEATYRAAVLAMLQRVEQDSMASLGSAFRALAAGDSMLAAERFEVAAREASIDHGGAEMLVRAGQLLGAAGRPVEAERLLRAVVHPGAPAASAAALLELGRLLMATGRREAAVQELERLVLDYPGSALVPQARRLLDEIRRGVPST